MQIIDLTAPLSESTPVIELPPGHALPWAFERSEISRYESGGDPVYWNNFRMSEHTGTHFDAPIHWLSGKDLDDVASVPPKRLLGPAVVLDFSEEAAADPDFLLRREQVERWMDHHGPLPKGGWLLYRTGWDARVHSQADFLNGGHTPGVHPDCARWLAQDTDIVGLGVETVGTDAGQAASFPDQPFPCHWCFQGANKYGLTQLQNLSQLPATGAFLLVSPLPIVEGSGSPCRVFALVE